MKFYLFYCTSINIPSHVVAGLRDLQIIPDCWNLVWVAFNYVTIMETTTSRWRQTAWRKIKAEDIEINSLRGQFASVQELFVQLYARSLLSFQQFLHILRMTKVLRDKLHYCIERLPAQHRQRILQQAEQRSLQLDDIAYTLLQKKCPICEWKRRAKKMAERNSSTRTCTGTGGRVWQDKVLPPIEWCHFSHEQSQGCLFLSVQALKFTCEQIQTPISSQVSKRVAYPKLL